MQKEDKMSVQNVIAFAQKLNGNDVLQNQVKALTPGDSAGVVKLAADLGLDFTIQELQATVANAGEMNDNQLDQVVGGGDGSVRPTQFGLLLPAVQPAINGNLNGGTLNFRKAG